MTISVIIHTYNSEKYLRECLESVKKADEILICDMYSTDNTIKIAEEFGCKIIYHENVGFADPARNWAISQASGDFVFIVDSDEIIPPELWDYLRDFELNNPIPHIIGVTIPRKNLLLGKFLRSWYPNQIQRFWKKGCVYWPEKVHENPTTLNGGLHHIDPKRQELAIIHYNYDSIESFISRSNKYTSLEVPKMLERGKKFSLSYLIFRPIAEFLKKYILKQGYKDGLHGFIFAVYASIYEFIAISKIWEYELKNIENNK
jgi:glycosyltransferase involved in cell wall biosynthesis